MSRTDGSLVPTDEGLNHQIADTFASVLQSDRNWTEKICGSIGCHDGSLQIGFGLGKYINRNVMDAYCGVSRGVSQWTVRSSRQLAPDPDITRVGPIHYEVIEPLKKIRICLEENAVQPIAFDLVFDGSDIPPFLENHEFRRAFAGYRVDNDLVRYHQVGVASGNIVLEGKRYSVEPERWYATRDHSWGLRYGVGIDPPDLMPGIDASQFPMQFLWSPMRFTRPDGSHYAIHHFYLAVNVPGVAKTFHASLEHPDGSVEYFADMEPELRFDSCNRRLLGGSLQFVHQDGRKRRLEVRVISDTGLHLGPGLYFGFDGHYHGEWRGALHTDGEFIADCSERRMAERVHQIRDCLVEVRDGDAIAYANYQSIVNGIWPELSLDENSNFL